MKRYFVTLMMVLFLTACAGNGARDNPGAPEAQQAREAIAEAETAAEKADSVGYLWRDTEQLIDEAKKAADEENYEQAVELAEEARRQSELGYQQYLDQRDAATGD